uniref:Uncharacterized protein n=1 Tax=Oryza rufipogon TaxID=4529 RepID=A0A0E0NH51_ORYRU
MLTWHGEVILVVYGKDGESEAVVVHFRPRLQTALGFPHCGAASAAAGGVGSGGSSSGSAGGGRLPFGLARLSPYQMEKFLVAAPPPSGDAPAAPVPPRRHRWSRVAAELDGRIDARFRHRESVRLRDSFSEDVIGRPDLFPVAQCSFLSWWSGIRKGVPNSLGAGSIPSSCSLPSPSGRKGTTGCSISSSTRGRT